jgi:hypothetical protein
MSATNNPFGFRAAYHYSGGVIRPTMYTVVDATQAAYATSIYNGAPVVWNTNGSLNVAAAAADWLGVFAGCEYTDSTGKPVNLSYWPGTTTGATNIRLYVLDDPNIIYEVQCTTTLTSAICIGDQLTTFDGTYTAGSGSSTTGQSTAAFSGVLAGAGVQGMARIIGAGRQVDNAFSDSYPIVQVQNARHQYVAVKTAI